MNATRPSTPAVLRPRWSAALAALVVLFALHSPSAASAAAALPADTAAALRERRIWAHEASDLAPDAAVVYGQLPNGLRYALLRNALPTGTAAIRLRFGVGSLMEAEDQRGIAHFLEHMVFNGSQNVPEGEMVKLLERYGLAFGPDTNAYTSFLETVYQLDLPDTRDELLDKSLMLMRETADRLLLSPTAIDRERGVILSEKRTRETPQFRALVARLNFLYPEGRIGQRLPIGTEEVITTADRERFLRLYRGWYRPDNALLVVVGDLDPAAVEPRIRAQFGDWKRPDTPIGVADPGRLSPPALAAGYFQDPSIPTIISFGPQRPLVLRADNTAERRAQLVRDLGFAILSRRFDTLTRQPGTVLINGDASYQETFDFAEGPSVSVVAKPENWQAALAIGEQELRRALQHGFSDAELKEQLSNLRTAYRNAAEGAATRRSRALANALVDDFDGRSVFTTPAEDLRVFEAAAGGISRSEVEAAFRAAWGDDPPRIFMTSSLTLEKPAQEILAAFNTSRAVAVAAPAATQDVKFAYANPGTPGKVVVRGEVADLGIVTAKLDNGVLLNIKRTPYQKDRVSVLLRFGDGQRTLPKSQPGLDFWIDNALGNAGLGKHSTDELQRVLAGRNWTLGVNVGEDAFVSAATVPPADLELQLQIITALLTDPGYRPEAFDQFRELVGVWRKTVDATPQGVLNRDLGRILRDGDPRYGIPTLEELQARQPAEIRAVLDPAMRDGPMEIAIVGDIDPERAITAVAATLGTLPARKGMFDRARGNAGMNFPSAPLAPIVLRHEGEASKAQLAVAWPARDGFDRRRTRIQNLVGEVLQIKMTDTLREKLGATYSPGVSIDASDLYPGYGAIFTSLDVKPAEMDTALAAVKTVAADVRAGRISVDEFDRARKPIIEGLKQRFENNGFWLEAVSQAQSQGDWLERTRKLRSDYESITLEEVKSLAAELFDPKRAIEVRVVGK
ncbi:MAG: insulinase family protein [Gammaproteobacteria bacterium]|nr:insulinase family protein [Gammaproteobacteria bacterium]